LAAFLLDRGHEVILLLSEQASYRGEARATRVQPFTSTASLRDELQKLAETESEVIFHAAAVSDFSFGKVWLRSAEGKLSEIKGGKISTREGTLLAELKPTPKIIADLRHMFPKGRIIGWKFEVDGKRAEVIRLAEKQMEQCLTDACVANGPAYGQGFGFVKSDQSIQHLPDKHELFEVLEEFIRG
jgi:phosphopantothenoylcysteine decarboxylase/phosphopantothenate--cysteine ligase